MSEARNILYFMDFEALQSLIETISGNQINQPVLLYIRPQTASLGFNNKTDLNRFFRFFVIRFAVHSEVPISMSNVVS
jgi:hypothetical protein